jgi:hypothetical protein
MISNTLFRAQAGSGGAIVGALKQCAVPLEEIAQFSP